MSLSDAAHVAEQYEDASRFDARVRIYELYDASAERWLSWLYTRLRLAPGERVLELGCGTANLWRENAARVPALGALVLTDLSPGMLDQARARLAGLAGLAPELRVADAQSLALPDASFDVVIANHMLYHVPDRSRALAEVRRVLRPGGRFLVGTNDWTHLLELRELLTRFGVESRMIPTLRDPALFDLETATEEIAQAGLEVVRVERRTSALEIRAVEPLLDYVRSMIDGPTPSGDVLAPLARHVARQIELMGSLHVGIAAGLVEARRG